MAAEAYIIDAIRTPVGRKNGGLSRVHPADLAAHCLTSLIQRNPIEAELLDDVILGCFDQIGPQTGDIARIATLAAGFPESVPGVTVDRQCGSSQQAIHFAAMAVMSGVQDLVIAGGVQNMSLVPIGSAITLGKQSGMPLPTEATGWVKRYGTQEISQYRGAELVAKQWHISRQQMETYALESHQRAITAIDSDIFAAEITPVDAVIHDECPRRDTSLEKMQTLKPLREGGRITAALASQIADGAAALLIASEKAVQRYGLHPRARIHQMTVLGADPVKMLTAPIPATRHALNKCGLNMRDIDLVEINEAFAPVVLAWQHELDADLTRVNVNGGAIALGHPLGASGARLMTTLLYELERRKARFGLQSMCEAGGQANVTIIERVS